MLTGRALGSIAACLLALGAGGAHAAGGHGEAGAAGALAWRAEPAPFRLEFLRGSRLVAAEPHVTAPKPSPGSRLAYWLADGTVHRVTDLRAQHAVAGGTAYDVATDEPGRTARVTVTTSSLGVRVSFEVLPASGVAGVYEAFAAAQSEHFLGTGERGGYVDLRGQIVQLKVSYDCASTIVTPFFLSSGGYGVYLATSAVGQIQFAGHHDGAACQEGARGRVPLCRLGGRFDRVELCVKTSRLDYDVYAGTPEQVVAAYTARSGRPSLPPPSQLELVKWRDEVSGEAELLDDVRQLQRRGIPLGWELLDNPWESGGCLGTLTFDANRFPDPKRTISSIHALGVRFMLWVSPLVTRLDGCPPSGYPAGTLVAGDTLDTRIDLTSPTAFALFTQRLVTLLRLGVDGLKADRGDAFDIEPERLAGGDGVTLHNAFPVSYAEAVAAAFRAAGLRPAGFFRAGFTGSQSVVPAVWAGDQESSFEGLQQAIRMGQTAGISGFPVWGSDIGGYSRGFQSSLPPLTSELFVRWAQFAAVTPVFEVGGAGRNARFWELGPKATGLFKAAAVLHYELAPYLYGLMRAASATGAPVLRPLGFSYPQDEQAWAHDLELLVGPDLIAAPVAASGTQVSVYLPSGNWVDLERGATLRGPRSYMRRTPLAELPLYLRAGAAIPFNLRTPDVWADPWRTNDLLRAGRAGWLYAPGSRAVSAVSNEAGRLNARTEGTTVTLSFSRAPRELQTLVLTRSAPRRVTIAGRVVPAARSLAELRRSREGWIRRAGPAFAGVMVKLAPAGGAARVAVDLGPAR